MPTLQYWPDALSSIGALFGQGQSIEAQTTAFFYNGLASVAFGTLTSAQIVGSSAGQLGHANGTTLVPAPPLSTQCLYPSAIYLVYKFAVAAYTGGGNVTLQYTSGGSTLTTTISAANLAASGSDKIVALPLLTSGINLTAAAGFSLKSASAYTQPGTAAGTINWLILYTVISTTV